MDLDLHIWLGASLALYDSACMHMLTCAAGTLGAYYPQEALAKPPTATNTKMYDFGAVALRQFVNIVYLWPQFCARVLQVSLCCLAP